FLPWGNNWYPQAWYWTFGGDIIDWESGRPTVDTAHGVQVYELFQDFAQRYPDAVTGPLANGQTSFIAGTTSLLLHASGFLGIARENDLNVGGGPAPYPATGHSGAWTGGGALAIPRG